MTESRVTDQPDFDQLEQDLKVERSGNWIKLTDRLRWLEGYRPWVIAIGVTGAMAGSLSRIVEDPIWGSVMAIGGAFVAAMSGIAVAAFDFKKLELSSSLGKVETVAERAIAAGRTATEAHARLQDEFQQLDRRRVHRLTALSSMREMLEQSIAGELGAEAAASATIDVAIFDIVGAIGFEPGEYWTLSVFEIDETEEEAFRIAAGWVDRAGAQSDGRSWRMGEGYTGVAWRDGAEVIEGDTSTPAAQRRYLVAGHKARAYDGARYRSVASVPIRAGSEHAIWGVVTATSDKPGRFSEEALGSEIQAVDMVRDVAGLMALLAVLERFDSGDASDAEDA